MVKCFFQDAFLFELAFSPHRLRLAFVAKVHIVALIANFRLPSGISYKVVQKITLMRGSVYRTDKERSRFWEQEIYPYCFKYAYFRKRLLILKYINCTISNIQG